MKAQVGIPGAILLACMAVGFLLFSLAVGRSQQGTSDIKGSDAFGRAQATPSPAPSPTRMPSPSPGPTATPVPEPEPVPTPSPNSNS